MFRNLHKGCLDRGAAAVEMALVLPLLLLVLFGLIDFGRAFNAQMQLTQAAREGVRVIALNEDQAAALARVKQAMPGFVGPDTPTVFSSTLCAPDPPADGLGRLNIESKFTFLTPLGPIAKLFGGSSTSLGDVKTLSAEGVMRCSG